MNTVDSANYTLIPYVMYKTLDAKLQYLLNGGVLLLKKFEQKEGVDVLVQLVDKKFTITQISYDMRESADDPRYWITFNVGINDLSLLTAFQFEEDIFLNTNKFMVNDVITYLNDLGKWDSAVIEEVHVSNLDPNQYAYKFSRQDGLYAEEDLIKNIYL